MDNILALESKLWDSADRLRSNSSLTSDNYVFPVLGLIFLKYSDIKYQAADKYLKANQKVTPRGPVPIEPRDYNARHALCLPLEAQYSYISTLPESEDIGKKLNDAMEIIEGLRPDLKGILPKKYNELPKAVLVSLLRIFNDSGLDTAGDDIIGRIYEYFIGKFAQAGASENGMFFTPLPLVSLISHIVEPRGGVLLDPACGSGGMFLQAYRYAEECGHNSDNFTFYGQELKDTTANLCRMNIAVHSLRGHILSGDSASSYYHDPHKLEGRCDYVMANPPFNDGPVNAKLAADAGRLPFGVLKENKDKEITNANYLWIQYFYSYLNDHGRAGFVLASSATDSGNQDAEIRQKLINTGHVDVLISVANNFFYTVSLPCSLWFMDKAKPADRQDKILFIDARNYYTVVSRKLNEWTIWQRRNLAAIAYLYRGEQDKYKNLISQYVNHIQSLQDENQNEYIIIPSIPNEWFSQAQDQVNKTKERIIKLTVSSALDEFENISLSCRKYAELVKEAGKAFIAEMDSIDKKEKKAFLDKYCSSFKTLQMAKKSIQQQIELAENRIISLATIVDELVWLVGKFGTEGVYRDITGLCHIATLKEVEQHNWSLTPGAYVGVAEESVEDVDFQSRMNEIHSELAQLNAEANTLMQDILKEWEGLR